MAPPGLTGFVSLCEIGEFGVRGISLPSWAQGGPWGGTDGGAAALGAGSPFTAQSPGIPPSVDMWGEINPGREKGNRAERDHKGIK